jgi:pyridoxine kinase
MTILAIQSQVICGHVGNAAAAPALQAIGEEILAIPTVLLSHHPGHGGARGAPTAPALLATLVEGLAAHGALARVGGILSGYLGAADAADALDAARAHAPGALYLCDPVLGDDGRLYVTPAVVDAVRRLVAQADIVTPNAFELSILADAPAGTCDAAVAALSRDAAFAGLSRDAAFAALSRDAAFAGMKKLARPCVVLTSFTGTDTAPGTLDILALENGARHIFTIPKHARHFSGAGDLFASLLLAFRLRTGTTRAAIAAAIEATRIVLDETEARGAKELAIIEARAALAACAARVAIGDSRR